jgi:hypothetical protein
MKSQIITSVRALGSGHEYQFNSFRFRPIRRVAFKIIKYQITQLNHQS